MALLSGCNDHPLKDVDLSRNVQTVVDVDIAPLRNVDILFVIDNSGSMAAEQANLARNLAPFIETLEREDVAADYRIAVTTTDTGTGPCTGTGPEDGNFVATSCRSRLEQFSTIPGFQPAEDAQDSACTALCPEALADLRPVPSRVREQADPQERPWLENILGTTNLPEGVSTSEAFACMGPQGINGCGFESPLRAMRRALVRAENSGENEFGFLRDDAILLVVFVTDEADCSVQPGAPSEMFVDENGQRAGSEACWTAGVRCTELPGGELDCVSANLDLLGNEVPGDEALLTPVETYVELLEAIADEKREVLGGDVPPVLVSLVAGVPSEFPAVEVTYTQDTPFVDEYGVDAGCISDNGEGVPPVRLLEFAEAFGTDARSNVSSVCADSYAPAFEDLADILLEAFEPACSDSCLAGGGAHDCVFSQAIPGEGDVSIPTCERNEAGAPVLPAGADVCVDVAIDAERAPACVEQQAPVEFRPLYRAGVPRVSGTRIEATCSVSENALLDCPWAQ
ncbi:MAG: VWA domain-containing protein [Myxococcota bacterium]